MKHLGNYSRSRFEDEDVNPINYLSNLSDAMLVLAVGIMLALIVHWNVDISTSGGVMSDTGMSYAATGEGGTARLDTDAAVTISAEEMQTLESQENSADSDSGEGMEKRGELYYDAATDTYYLMTTESTEVTP